MEKKTVKLLLIIIVLQTCTSCWKQSVEILPPDPPNQYMGVWETEKNEYFRITIAITDEKYHFVHSTCRKNPSAKGGLKNPLEGEYHIENEVLILDMDEDVTEYSIKWKLHKVGNQSYILPLIKPDPFELGKFDYHRLYKQQENHNQRVQTD